jgi:FAD/FMN-containing dehydrogenase/Fe-S oxidoreductase
MIHNHPDTLDASKELIHELNNAVQAVAFDQMTRILYSTDASIYQMMPVGVVFPRDVDEVSAAVEITKNHGVPILPRGGGSSLCGNAIGHAVILDLSRYMDKVIEIDGENHYVRVQPGVTLGNLNHILTPYNLMYGPDPASGDRATMGGILANNSTGAHSIVYGMTHDHVLSTDVVLSDGNQATFTQFNGQWDKPGVQQGLVGTIYNSIGTILEKYSSEISARYPNTFRHVAGYNLHALINQAQPNLAQLIVGSEGTLGVITEATLNLVPIPRVKRLAMVHFIDQRQAMEAVPTILQSKPTAIEVLDKMLLDLTRNKVEYRRLLTFIEGDPAMVLLVEFSGDTEAELDSGIERLKSKLNRLNHQDPIIVVSNPKEQAKVWYVRKLGLGILMSVPGDAKPIPFIEDAAVPVEHLADYITEIYAYADEVGVGSVAVYAHASAGCLHVRPLVNLKKSDGVRQLRQIAEKSLELVMKYDGTISGEHGEGIARGEFSEVYFGPQLTQAFKEIKNAFDPSNHLNPGKMVNVPRMDDESLLRYGSQYVTPFEPQNTGFDYQKEGGFGRAVEMCNGAGVCRKIDKGVMCPSFQATRDETHSTRGRANALRSAMMGLLGQDGMTSREVYEVMDLCLSCHACKSECPSAVDMAKIKAEFLHQYYKEHGVPLRAWIFTNIGRLYKVAQPFAPVFNLIMNGPGKWIATMIGIHPERSFPSLSRQTFSAWFKKEKRNKKTFHGKKRLVFFHDTFMEHSEPQVGKSAIKVLDAAGYDVVILDGKVDSGRPAVSKGLLDTAAKLAKRNIALLVPFVREGLPIVGCEPSVMAMLVDEYPSLVPGEAADAVASSALMVDEFITREASAGKIKLEFNENPRKILFHGHCQQKASFGTERTLEMLRLIPNCTVEEVDSGCCGMAGSFGYEVEHYDLSIQLAEMSLAPAVRSAPAETIICAAGTSCREQIAHTTNRKALHPIEIIAEALLPNSSPPLSKLD